MIKAALEKVINEDMAAIWTLLDNDEKRLITDNLSIHNFKKNQIIYAEGEQPEYIWCLLSGKVKKFKEGVGGRVQILRLIRPVQYSATAPISPASLTYRALPPSRLPHLVQYP